MGYKGPKVFRTGIVREFWIWMADKMNLRYRPQPPNSSFTNIMGRRLLLSEK
jgi:hypothetical protein